MKVFSSSLLFLTGVAVAQGSGAVLPWVEDFAGLANGATSDSGDTSWTVTRDYGKFEITDGVLEIYAKAQGTFSTGDIDVSAVKYVEIKTSLYGDKGLDSSGDFRDHVQVYAELDNGRTLLVSHKFGGANKFQEDLVGIVDVSDIETLSLKIKAKTTGGDEVYHIQEIQVSSVGDDNDGCTYYDLNMDSLAEGTYVSDQFSVSHGVNLSCNCTKSACINKGAGKCRVFDTANPVGDPDLGSPNEHCPGAGPKPGKGDGGKPGTPGENCWPVGHILIVDENGDGVPDDAVGGWIEFTFTQPVEFLSIDQLDNEGSEDYKMEFYRGDSLVTTVKGAYTGDNGYAATPLLEDQTKDIDMMKLVLSGSGSVNSVKYRTCPSTLGASKTAGAGGDPYFKRWNRKSFEFHGECDLVLVHSDHVNGDKVLDIHVRTVIKEWWSQIESAAMRIGDVTLQMEIDKFFINGQEYSDTDLPIQTAEFLIAPPFYGNHAATQSIRGTGKNVLKSYLVTFNDKSAITFKLLKGFMNVEVTGHAVDFEQAIGLMGDYQLGKPYDRSGERMYDLHEFAMEWQVNPAVDPLLFLEAKGPQLPHEQCRMPSPEATARRSRRRLLGDKNLYAAAEEACATKGEEIDACMNDIMAVGDVAMALLH